MKQFFVKTLKNFAMQYVGIKTYLAVKFIPRSEKME